MLMNKLLPCPFCNGFATIDIFKTDSPQYEYVVSCSDCSIQLRDTCCSKDSDVTMQHAVDSWNKRV